MSNRAFININHQPIFVVIEPIEADENGSHFVVDIFKFFHDDKILSLNIHARIHPTWASFNNRFSLTLTGIGSVSSWVITAISNDGMKLLQRRFV